MATQIQWRRGTTAQTASFTGAVGETTVDTSKNTLVIHDGTTAGGFPLARESALSANASQIQASFNQANTAFIAATSAGIYANGAFVSSNTIQTYVTSANANISLLFSYVNTANANITAAFAAAGSAGVYANAAFIHANASFAFANTISGGAAIDNVARSLANSAVTLSEATDATQNNSIAAAFTQANTGVTNAAAASNYANAAFLAANSAATLSAATDATQNTNITNAQNTADAAFLASNTAATLSDATDATQNNSIAAAFTRANNSISANAGGTITGDLVVTGNLTISGQTTYANTISVQLGDNIITLNSETPTSLTPTENAGIEVNRGNTFANSSLLWIESSGKWQANSGSLTGAYFLADESVVTAAFLAANSAATLSAATDATQNNSITAAFLAANSAATLSAATDATQNNSIAAAFTQANSVYLPSVTRLDVTNSGASAYLFDQYAGNNPELYIRAGETLAFNLNVTGHPFLIRVSNGGSNYSNGLTHVTTTGTVTTGSSAQGQVAGTLYWKVPAELAGNTYVYQCQVHGGMVGNIVIERPNHDFTNISVAAGTYGNATHYGVVSVAANGRVTSVSTFPVVDSSAIAFSIALG
jgi:hypothetical protein